MLQGYAAAAADLAVCFEQVSSALLYNPVADLLPRRASTIVDIGAGTGRDAAWLAGKGMRSSRWSPSTNCAGRAWCSIKIKGSNGSTIDFLIFMIFETEIGALIACSYLAFGNIWTMLSVVWPWSASVT